MSNTIEIVKALNEGRLSEARTLIRSHMDESKGVLLEGIRDYMAESILSEEDDENDGESDGEGDEYDGEDELDEAQIITKVNSKGEKTKRKSSPEGYTRRDGKLVKMGASERHSRSKGAKRAVRQRVGQENQIKRKTAKAMKKRKSMGL